MRSLAFVACLVVASGCAGWQPRVINQASFDHNCPKESVAILSDSGDPIARTVDLNVCGQRRRYRDYGGERVFLWQDVTDEQ